MSLDRRLLFALAVAFSGFNVLRGIVTLGDPVRMWPALIALALYSAATVAALVGSGRLRPAQTVAVLVATAAIPPLVTSQIPAEDAVGYASWHVASLGVLMTILVVRRRPIAAWAGTAFLVAQTVAWAGPGRAVSAGVSGAVLWVALACVFAWQLRRIGARAAALLDAARQAAHWRAAQDAHDRARVGRIEQTTRVATPMLRQVILAGGDLDADGRAEAGRTEAELRDEIRGRALLTDRMRGAVREARRRGANVAVLDEGTIDDLAETDRVAAVDAAAAAIETADAARIVVRTGAADSETAVSVVCLVPSEDPADPDETVTLWVEVARDGSSTVRRGRGTAGA